ncbi:YhdH/YhfP family quinone oxidoreductase [Mangrovitalea sediminis]|uniref:YhdH/YhfP family quinone oxidoreductase n=1 Tax=Mangrovitalea sediminis TaxID=1982043 RepID=UPI000BE5724A|nr:YhdH/YhfP family quinone oxidoreductase [Mangrovitalea sediminis]
MVHFRAWRVHEKDGQFQGSIDMMTQDQLPEGEVLVRVSHSSLNYKDALSASGNKGVTREYPHTPGIDAAGVVESSTVPAFHAGDRVIVTGYDLGMNTDGGFGEYIRVPAAWCLPMPESLSGAAAMSYGTAGLTAALCVDKLLRMGLAPDQGPVLVTGASGGVGTVAVELLARLGFEVVALSGKHDEAGRLKQLGAIEIVDRAVLETSKRPLQRGSYAGAVDTVGGTLLAELLKVIRPGGAVACCGMVGGIELPTTVFPFILRGISLLGVDSVEIPLADKQRIWEKLSSEWRCPQTEQGARTIGLESLGPALKAFLEGHSRGRVVLAHQTETA